MCLEQGCIDCLRAVLDAGTALQIRGGEVGHPFLKLQEVRGLAAWRIMALPKSFKQLEYRKTFEKKSHLQSLTKMKINTKVRDETNAPKIEKKTQDSTKTVFSTHETF